MKIHYNGVSKRTVVRLFEKEAEISVSSKLKQILALPASHLTFYQFELAGQDMVQLDP